MDWLYNTRMIERILIVIGGIVSLVLGYLLFVKGVSGEASLIMEFDKKKIQLINALPGIFFALFGAVILIASTRAKLTTTAYNKRENTKQPGGGLSNRSQIKEVVVGKQTEEQYTKISVAEKNSNPIGEPISDKPEPIPG